MRALRDVRDGEPAAAACRRLGITETTFYRWRAKHETATAAESRRVRELEEENRQLKLLVADLVLQAQGAPTPRIRRR